MPRGQEVLEAARHAVEAVEAMRRVLEVLEAGGFKTLSETWYLLNWQCLNAP